MIKRLTYFISLLILPSIPLAQHSLSFDGSDDYVLAQVSSSSLGTQASISTWIYSDVFDGEASVIDLYNSADEDNQRDILTIKYHLILFTRSPI